MSNVAQPDATCGPIMNKRAITLVFLGCAGFALVLLWPLVRAARQERSVLRFTTERSEEMLRTYEFIEQFVEETHQPPRSVNELCTRFPPLVEIVYDAAAKQPKYRFNWVAYARGGTEVFCADTGIPPELSRGLNTAQVELARTAMDAQGRVWCLGNVDRNQVSALSDQYTPGQ